MKATNTTLKTTDKPLKITYDDGGKIIYTRDAQKNKKPQLPGIEHLFKKANISLSEILTFK